MGIHYDLLLEAVLERLGSWQRSAAPCGGGGAPPQPALQFAAHSSDQEHGRPVILVPAVTVHS